MRTIFVRIFQLGLAVISLTPHSESFADNTHVWGEKGCSTTTSNILLETNWDTGFMPEDGDTAIFSGLGNWVPDLMQGDSFSPNLIGFKGKKSYNIAINGSLLFNQEASGKLSSGVQNLSTVPQTFEVYDDGEIVFGKTSNASFGSEGNVSTVNYNVGDIFFGKSGNMIFEDFASAGGAQIQVFEDSSIVFNGVSTADDAQITLTGNPVNNTYPAINFNDFADAGSAQIDIIGTDMAFGDASTANFATINLHGTPLIQNNSVPAVVDFYQTTTSGSATLNAVDGSIITFFDDAVADNAVINLGTGTASQMAVGSVDFLDNSHAGSSTINAKGGYANGESAQLSLVAFDDNASAKSATINLGDQTTGFGGKLAFFRSSHADEAVVHAEKNSQIVFNGSSNAGSATFYLKDQSVIEFNENSKSQDATIHLNDYETVLNLNPTGEGTFTGKLLGKGKLNKVGPGTLHFKGHSQNFHGSTNVHQGVLGFDNNYPHDVYVHNGGSLGAGAGKVLGNVTVNEGGNLAPGLGVVRIQGNCLQVENSVYQVQLSCDNEVVTSSFVEIGGTAHLVDGAKINIAGNSLGLQLPANKTFELPVLEAKKGLVGQYQKDVTSSNPLISGSIHYRGNSVLLSFINTFALIPKTHNQKKIGDLLQKVTEPTPLQHLVLNRIAALPTEDARVTLDQLSAAEYGTFLPFTELSNHRFIQRLYDPLRPIISALPSDPCDCECDPIKGREIWLQGGFTHNHIDAKNHSHGFKTLGYEFTLGAQAPINSEWFLGTALSFERTFFDHQIGSRTNNYSVLGALYGLYRPQGYYVVNDFIVGYSRYAVRRFIDIGDSSFRVFGHPEVFQGAYYIEAGMDFAWNCLMIQPFLALEADYFHRYHTKEDSHSHIADTSIKEESRGTAYSCLGVHFTTERYMGITLALDFDWRFRFTSTHNSIHARFNNFGSSFVVDGIELSRNSFDGVINLSATLVDGWDVYIEGSGQWWQRASSYTFIGGLEYEW